MIYQFKKMIRSFFFLLGSYFLRHVPLTIFWGLQSIFPFSKHSHLRVLSSLLFLIVSYGTSFLLLMSILIFVLNYMVIKNFQSTILPILLTEELITANNLNLVNNKYFSLLFSRLICSKKFAIPFKFALRLLEFFALIAIGVGLVDILNDFSSHINPDLFDILFPLNGALPFYGGVTLLSLTAFFLYFVFPSSNIQKWEKRLRLSLNFPASIRGYIVSPTLLHPFFFLTPKGRLITRKNSITVKTLTLLLKKALLDNKDQIPEEWLTWKFIKFVKFIKFIKK